MVKSNEEMGYLLSFKEKVYAAVVGAAITSTCGVGLGLGYNAMESYLTTQPESVQVIGDERQDAGRNISDLVKE
ncbi:MAG: hypothetical protein QT02_C0001G0052 [archaeon GW2011_AR9]|nr:MAG: hypothetical protein QT02_C0001G0052 [archaeon GW2011_AR9]MBS3120241.1 hypothetical protein [Candidatus Woesearchaeota archaeon]